MATGNGLGGNRRRAMRKNFAVPAALAVIAAPLWGVSGFAALHVTVGSAAGFFDFWTGIVSIACLAGAGVATAAAAVSGLCGLDSVVSD